MTNTAQQEAAALRHAVESQDFAAIPGALEQYVRAVDQTSVAMLAEAADLIEWARRNVRAGHVRLSEERDRLRGIALYRETEAPRHQFHVDA